MATPAAARQEPALSRAALAAYALPAAPVQFIYILFIVMYMKFATDRLGASAAAVGLVFLASKVWDAVSDPVVGTWSDRTRSRLGRRRSWLLGSALPLFLFGFMAWSPPRQLEGAALLGWIAVAIFGFYTAYTAFTVPHMALGAEITLRRQERNRVFGTRHFSTTVGMLVGAVAGPMIVDHPETGRAGAFWLSLVIGAITGVSIVVAVRALPAERAEFMGRGGENPLRAVRDVWTNPHARLLLFVFFIESLGTGAIGVLTPYVIRYVLQMPEITGPMLGAYMLSGLLAIPVWVLLARRFEKRHLWLFAMVQGGVGFGILFWMDAGTWPLMVLSSVLAGSAGSCGNTLGQALKAEIIDVDEHRTGERKEGAYFAAWSFMGKLAGGLMVGVVGVVLEAVGYRPNVEQAGVVREWMLFLMGGMPLVGYGIGALAFSRFRLSQAEHARIRAELDARAAGPA